MPRNIGRDSALQDYKGLRYPITIVVLTYVFPASLQYHITPAIVNQITNDLPTVTTTAGSACSPLLQELKLADPAFYKPGRIDILLELDIHSNLMQAGAIFNPEMGLRAYQFFLGWIVAGSSPIQSATTKSSILLHICAKDREASDPTYLFQELVMTNLLPKKSRKPWSIQRSLIPKILTECMFYIYLADVYL